MKIPKIILTFAFLCTGVANAGCLDGLSGSDFIKSKIRGFYVNPSNDQYVILDKSTCSASQGNTTLANGTTNYYYLKFDSSNSFLASSLLAAYTTKDLVEFRVGTIEGSYNKIAYVIIPADSRSQ
jgi:hypothetical protein